MNPVDRPHRPALDRAALAPSTSGEPLETPAPRRRTWPFVAIGVGISLALAALVSFYASGAPDGLNRVAADLAFADHAQESATSGSPVAGYAAAGVADDRLAVGVAGVVGVAATGLLAFALFLWLGRRNRAGAAPEGSAPDLPGTPSR